MARIELNQDQEAKPGPDTAALAYGAPVRTVKQVNALLQQVLATHLPGVFCVAGEISNLRVYDRGHAFFTLKESGAELPCICWKDALGRMKFKPKDGMAVVARGAIKMYEAQGRVQLYVEALFPQGVGELELAFRQLCEKLRAEGLFETARKRPLPRVPQRIVVITSRTGDVLHDVLTTAYRRYPGLHTLLYPVRVQGEEAAGQIVDAIKTINAQAHVLGGVDLIMLVRGGGSLEDLWAFNEEIVARAICASVIPIVTGIGHEPDTTIADLVSDLRGPTPTGVTELVIPDVASLCRELDARGTMLTREMLRQIDSALGDVQRLGLEMSQAAHGRLRLENLRILRLAEGVAHAEPRHAVAQGWRRVEEAQRQLAANWKIRMMAARQKIETNAVQLKLLGPQSVLDRGYSITSDAHGKIVRSKQQVLKGDKITTRVADGEFTSTVGQPKQSSLF